MTDLFVVIYSNTQIVRTIKAHSQCCIDNLISPIDTIEQDYQVFSPKIPDDLHIHFVIKDNLLVITSEHTTDNVVKKGAHPDKEYAHYNLQIYRFSYLLLTSLETLLRKDLIMLFVRSRFLNLIQL